ncbi:MAG: DUF1697 domain-containing protein [Bradyrhizobium sp.]|nr:MAG: DUF1697 domain-containing protein [Bradyrhizobium sp.]
MTRYIALLRAVNVGGTGMLAMADLKAICVAAGHSKVATYIASGNVVFESRATAQKVKSELETRLAKHTGKPVGVLLRTLEEMRAVLQANPFSDRPPAQTLAIFLDKASPADALSHATGQADEEMRLGLREIYVHYGAGMGRSKLKIPAAKLGTARNMNTVARLVAMAAEG